MLNSQKRKKNTVLLSFITNFTAENAPTSGRYLWRHWRTATSKPIKMLPSAMSYYTIMDFLLSKYGLIFTEFDSIDRGGAEVNTFKFSKYQTIFTE